MAKLLDFWGFWVFLGGLFSYKNIPQMSFDDTGREPEQAFRLNRDPAAELEYPTKWEHERQ